MQLKKTFTNRPELSRQRNKKRLEVCLRDKSRTIKNRLAKFLGSGVRILGEPDAENRKYTMVFVSGELGPVGRLDLIYGGQHASPADVKYGVYADGEGAEEREALMKEIYNKARGMFRCGMYWQASYYRGGEEIGRLEFIDEYSRRARNTAFHKAPPGCDAIKLRTPHGKVMVKTEMVDSGKWREEKTKPSATLADIVYRP